MQSGLQSKSLEAVGGAQKGCHNVSQAYKNQQISKPARQVKVYFSTDAFFYLAKKN
jgi:DNA polymerase III delta subunit